MALIDRALLITVVPPATGTAAAGLVGGLLLALVLTPAVVLAAVARALAHGDWREVRWRPLMGLLLVVVLLSLAVAFSGEELNYWYSRGVAVGALVGLVLALVCLPFAWLRGRGRARARQQPWRRSPTPAVDRSRHALARFAAAVVLLASTVPAALLKQRVYPEHLAWSIAEAVGLAVVALPFAWLLGRVWCRRRHGSSALVWAAAIALGGWLSLAGRPLLIHQTTAAMQELASMVSELQSGAPVQPRPLDRWRFGECAPLVKGMSGFYRTIQSSLAAFDRLEPVLTRTSFRDAAELTATEARLDALRSRVAALDEDIERSARQLRATIENGHISSLMRERILKGVGDGLEGRPRLRELLAPTVTALEQLVGFMKAKAGGYRYEGSDIVFASDAEALTFNRLVEQVESAKSRALAAGAASRLDLKKRAEEFGHWAEDPFRRPRPERGR